MNAYCTIHTAPMVGILDGIVSDLPRYYGERISFPVTKRGEQVGRNRTPAARAIQRKMLEMIATGNKVTTMQMVYALDSNRFSIYMNAHVMEEEGLIKLVKVRNKCFHWEVV